MGYAVRAVTAFVERYNRRRYHNAIDTLTPRRRTPTLDESPASSSDEREIERKTFDQRQRMPSKTSLGSDTHVSRKPSGNCRVGHIRACLFLTPGRIIVSGFNDRAERINPFRYVAHPPTYANHGENCCQ